MKRRVMFLLLVGCVTSLHAQNWLEWTQQKKTQIKYLVNQLAALQVYIELGQQGYSIYKDGLEVIGDIKNGEFDLHKDYFGSRSGVNPHIGGSPKVAEMILFNEQIQLFRQRIHALELGEYSASIRSLFDQLSKKSSDHAAQLKLLISPDHYQLTDAQRFEQINPLHKRLSKLYGFAKEMYQDAVLHSRVLPKEEKEIEIIERMEGLK